MPTDSEHLRTIVEAAFAYLGCPEKGYPHSEALAAVSLMLSRLEQAEKRPETMLDIAHDIMADYGFTAYGVRHTKDPPHMVETVLRLAAHHLPKAAWRFIESDGYFDDKVEMMTESATTRRLVLRVPKSGHELPRDTPRELITVLNVALMRKVDLLFLAPECPVFDGLPVFAQILEPEDA